MTVFKCTFFTVLLSLNCLITYSQEQPSIDATEPGNNRSIALSSTSDTLELRQKEEPNLLKDQAAKSIDFPGLPGQDSVKKELADLPLAAQYDKLWMEELRKTADLFEEMQAEVQNPDTTASVLDGFSTEILKQRLSALNEKTPFQIEYNPSLERVIKSFLLGKRDLMERMLTASQFYFPMFEQELDNFNIPPDLRIALFTLPGPEL